MRPLRIQVAAICLLFSASVSAAPDAPTNLAVEDRVDPIGIGDPTPEFSWIARDAEPNAVQSAYQILVASSPEKLRQGDADRWDSGKVRSSSVAFITYDGKSLRSREVCYWKVRTADGEGRWGPWSEAGHFEIGLLRDKDWAGAQWIWAPKPGPEKQYFYFRKAFTLPDRPIARARIYVSSVHHHLLYVDEKLVGKGPNFENPERQYYEIFDVGSYLKPGRKQVLATRCHWFGGGQGRPASRPGLLLKVVIDFADGSSMTVGSDKTWKSRRTEWLVEEKERRRGLPGDRVGGIPAEYIDGRMHPVGWNRPAYDDSDWLSALELGPQPTAPWTGPLIAQETTVDEYEIKPVSIRTRGDHVVADFGKVYSGMPRVHFSGGSPGARLGITVDYRQQPDGSLKGYAQATRLDFEYTLRGGEETFEPFWYLGFRYLDVDQCPEKHDFRMVVRHHKVDRARSSFECSDEMLNSIWELVKRSAMLGSQENFIDTPTREQGQFTHDSYQTSMAAMKCFGERDLTQKALREFAHSQDKWYADSGEVNGVYPYDHERNTPDWTQSWVFWAYEYYMETGDLELIGEIFGHLVKTGQYNKRSENRNGLVDWGNGFRSGNVDWPDRYGYDIQTTQKAVLSCFAYRNYVYISRLAQALKRDKEANRFAEYAADIRSAIREHLWNEEKQAFVDGLHKDGSQSTKTSQQANMLPLVLGMTEGGETRGALAAVKRAGYSTAPMLVRFLVEAYGDHDEDEALMKFLLDPEGHNWAYTIADGGSFTYENWRGRNRKDRGARSESHPVGAYGGVIAVQHYVLGVQPLEPQYARVRIRPHPGELKFAKGTIPTQRGPIGVSWKNDAKAGKFTMKVTLPCNVRADVYIPKGRAVGTTVSVDGSPRKGEDAGKYIRITDVGSGEHVFSVMAATTRRARLHSEDRHEAQGGRPQPRSRVAG